MRDRSSAGTALDDVTIYEQIVEQMDDAAFVVDAERRLRYANSSALEYAETSLEVIQHVPITTLAEEMIATEAGRERFERALDAVFAGDTDRESLTLELALASETLIGEYKFSPLTEAGSVVGVIVVARDVTELRRELREQSRILEQISENVVEVVWMNEPEQDDIQYVSAAYEDVWGRDREVLYEDPHAFVDAIHPEDRERVLDALDDQQADPDAYDETYRIVRPDGDVRWIHDCASGVYDEDGSLQRIVGVARDVTERKERERELSLYERVIEEAPVGITITDLGREDNPLTYVNERFEEITGYTAADCLGRNCRFLQGNNTDPSRVHQFREAIDTAEATTVELRNYRADGEAFWNRVSIAPVTDDDGAVSNYVGFQEDVTDHKRREQDLEQFAYAASHDLREPLRVISNYLQLLERRHGDQLDADAHEYVEYATDAAERMRDRIEGLLTYARVDQDENLEPVDLDDVVETVRSDLEIAIEQNDAKIIVGDLPTVEGNAEQLATVFQNLLDNALAHGGDDPPVVEISAEPQDGMWALTVADEGVGMAPEQVERGAQDYLVKSDVNATLLGRTIRYAIERQQRERQLRDRNEELMLLNRLVSHDIRDDMALVRGWGRPLYDNVDPDGRANLDRLLGATNHVIELTDTVADFLEVLHDRESMSLRPIELTATLDSEIEKVRARHEQVTIERVGAEGTVYVQATELLSSVFRNLLVNAVQHNDTDEPAVQVDVMADPDTVTVTFADDGPGVRDGQKDAVFGRTEAGLADPECSVGLYLVGTLLEMYDGEVTVTDNDPRGSVFEVTLQRADPAEV